MHRSRVSTLLIDAPRDEAAASAAFWTAALGVDAHQPPGEPQFTSLDGGFAGLVAAVQAVDDQARYHLDVETDDVAAETARLCALGAVEVVGRERPGLRAVACFDTAFHARLPSEAATYALPAAWRERHGLRRYGFHGLSHAHASRRATELLFEEMEAADHDLPHEHQSVRFTPELVVRRSTSPGR